MKTRDAIVPLLAVALMAGCKQSGTETPNVVVPPVETETQVADEPEAPVELVPVLRKAQPATPAKTKTATATTTATQEKPTSAPPLKGTIYVETDGAQGRVWGHVTMNGDRGTGTIHDWDENTLAVSVTRHGNELFAVDQNSRQYVFKLKK